MTTGGAVHNCAPEKVRLSTNAVLGKDEVQKIAADCCFHRLIDELRVVDPVVIVPMGTLACQQLNQVEHGGIYAYRGSISEIDLEAVAEEAYRRDNEI